MQDSLYTGETDRTMGGSSIIRSNLSMIKSTEARIKSILQRHINKNGDKGFKGSNFVVKNRGDQQQKEA
jgi:hypothetical protein